MRQPSLSRRFCTRLGWMSAAGAIAAGIIAASSSSASAQRTTVFELNQAICANDWDRALILTSNLMGSDSTNHTERTELIALRRQMELYRSEGTMVSDARACDLTNPYLINAETPQSTQDEAPLGWAGAVAEVTENQFSSAVITESSVTTLPVSLGNQPGLTPAEPLDLSQGLAAVSGHVGAGHEVYAFVAGMGDSVNINLEVTRVMTGSLYTTDDSQLFVFDKNGQLLASADDTTESRESRISDWIAPKTDVYFAVVTSYNNDPIFNQHERVVGWQDNGGGRFDYTLSVSGATPTNALLR